MQLLSNSQLSKLEESLSGVDAPDMTEAFRRGRLLDALVTAPHTVNAYKKQVITNKGEVNNFSPEEMKKGYERRDAFMNDALCKQIHSASSFQEDVRNENCCFGDYVVGAHAICDGRLKHSGMPWDLKSSSAASQGAFEDSFHTWSWDRQGYFFMEVCNSDKMLFIGVQNKKPFNIYKLWMIRGDERWRQGEEKTLDLVEKYFFLCANE